MLWLVVVRLRSAILHPSLILPGVTVRTSPIIPLPLPVTPPPPPPSPLLALSAVRPTRYDRIASTDVNGYDLRFEGATLQCGLGFNRECPIEQLKAACDELSACAGFSTFGYLVRPVAALVHTPMIPSHKPLSIYTYIYMVDLLQKLDVSKPLRKFSGDSSLYVRNVLNPLLEQPPAAAIAPLRAKVAAASPGVNPLDLVLINGVCPADSTMTRVGGAFGDGGKWICVSKSTRTAATAARCIVYSVGSNLDFSFEEALRVLLPNCNFYTFDCTVDRQVAMERKPIWLNFMHWCLVAEADISIQDRDRGLRGAVRGAHGEDVEKLGGQSFTWREFTKRLGHTNEEITLLKFDIECVCVRERERELHAREKRQTKTNVQWTVKVLTNLLTFSSSNT